MNLIYFQTTNLGKNLSNHIIEPATPPPLLKSISSLLLDFMLFKGSSMSVLTSNHQGHVVCKLSSREATDLCAMMNLSH